MDLFRNSASAKRLVGFLPSVRVKTAFRNNPSVREYKRHVMRSAFDRLLGPICDNRNGLYVESASGIHWCYPRLPFFVCDEKDLQLVTSMKNVASLRPCNSCLINFRSGQSIAEVGEVRKKSVMKEVA